MPRPATGYADSVIQRGPRIQQIGPGNGFGTINSGAAAATIAMPGVTSGDLLTVTCFPASFGAIASNQGYIAVTSVNPGGSGTVVVGTITGVAYPWDTIVHITRARTK